MARNAVGAILGSFVVLLSPNAVLAADWDTFTWSRITTPGVSGVYWQTAGDDEDDPFVTAVTVDDEGNVIEVTYFDENGEMQGGQSTDGSESLGDYIARTEGPGTDSGFYNPSNPMSGPYCFGFSCDSPSGPPGGNGEVGWN